MKALKGVIGGVVGGAIGAAIWAAVAVGTNSEVGWIAWGIGFLVGLGMKVGSKSEGAGLGIMAACLALLSVGAGKYAAVHYSIEKALSELGSGDVSDANATASLADDVAKESEAKGQPVAWPQGSSLDTASEEKDYPPTIWAEAKKRWEAKTPAERQGEKAAMKQRAAAGIAAMKAQLRANGFKRSFGLFDLLWAFLAVGTAFRIGSGGGSNG